jgi:CubicO group peptidase (beta-lactamase class C family)
MFRLAVSILSVSLIGAQTLPMARQQDIEKLITHEMARQSIPGLSVSVATGGDVVWTAGYGLSDVENFVPAKATTVYRLASISKPITATAILQLVEAGKIDLEAPIQRYVPTFPRKPWPITVRQLLSHLGGIRHYEALEEENSTRHYGDLLSPLRVFQNDPLVAEPGTKFHYTTFGYALLGAALENVSSMRYMDYLRQRIFAPSRMERIRQDHVFAIIPNRARGYILNGTGQVQNCSLADTSNKIPGGGLASTAEDIVRFGLAVRKGALLKPATLEMMFAPQKLRDGRLNNYGLGWALRLLDNRKVVAHTGGQQGVSTILLLMPRENVVVGLLCNLEKADLRELANRIARVLWETPARELSRSAGPPQP